MLRASGTVVDPFTGAGEPVSELGPWEAMATAVVTRDSPPDPDGASEDREAACRHSPQRRDRHRHEPLAHREALYVLADLGAPQQNLWWPPPELHDPAVRQPRRGHPAHGDHDLGRTETALGAFYPRLAYRLGKATAITATARKLTILVDHTLKEGLVDHDPGAAAYDAQHRQRIIRRLGLALVDRGTGEVLADAVS
jgi:hypothetical protein